MAKYRKLSRTADQRKALLRNQVTNLLYNGKIVTTEAKAKEIRKMCITGKVVHVRVGTKYLVNLDKLAEYLETGDSK